MKIYKKMNWFGIAVWATGCARLYKDGDGVDVIFRKWHPMTWLLYVVLTPLCGILGEKVTDVLPTRLSLFWTKNIDQLQWVTPFTEMDTLVPFRHF